MKVCVLQPVMCCTVCSTNFSYHHFFYITYIGMSCRESASHTHVSALLHALVALTPSHFAPSTSMLPSALSYLSLPTSVTSVVGRFLGRGKRTHRGCFSETCIQQRAESSSAQIEEFDHPEAPATNCECEFACFPRQSSWKVLCVSLLFDLTTGYWDST